MTSLSKIPDGVLTCFKTQLSRGGLTLEDAEWYAAANSLHLDELVQVIDFAHLVRFTRESFGPPESFYVRRTWRAIDGDNPGRVQIRCSPGGAEVRQRVDCPTERTAGHDVQTCPNCWAVKTYEPSDEWWAIGLNIRVLITPNVRNNERRLVRVMRRGGQTDPDSGRNIKWSEPWLEQKRPRGEEGWIDVAPGVQYTDRFGAFSTGILVRRATRLGRNAAWTTPRFVPTSPHDWTDIAPGVQAQFWVERPESKWLIEFRKDVNYQPVFATEPHWSGKQEFSWRGGSIYGLTISPFSRRSYGIAHATIEGVTITVPGQPSFDLPQLENFFWVLVAPNVRISLLYQGGGGYIEIGTDEPVSLPQLWTQPVQLHVAPLDHPYAPRWTYLSSGTRVAFHRGGRFEVEQLGPDGHWHPVRERIEPGSTQELEPGLRAAFDLYQGDPLQPKVQAQYEVSKEVPDEGWGKSIEISVDDQEWQHVLPGLEVKSSPPELKFDCRIWCVNLGVIDAPIGSPTHGGWNDWYAPSIDDPVVADWVEIGGGQYRVRSIPGVNRGYEFQMKTR